MKLEITIFIAIILLIIGIIIVCCMPRTDYNWAVIQIGDRAIEGSIKNYRIIKSGKMITVNFEDGNSYTTSTENVTLTNN